MPAIDTSSAQVYVHPIAVVSVSTKLGGTWTEVEYLRCQQIRVACSPEVSHALLRYDYGQIAHEDETTVAWTNTVKLSGVFVRIVITDTVDATPPLIGPANSITWYGVIQPDIRHPDGSTDPDDEASGHQDLVAFGLERLLEQQTVRTSVIAFNGTTPYTVQRGLSFNDDGAGESRRRGNMAPSKVGDSYLFSFEPRGQSEWDAYTAVEYLLARHSPTNPAGTAANKWRIDGSDTIINWYDIALETNGKTLKELLDALIPRSRGVSYWVDFDTSDNGSGSPKNECVIKPFTFVSSDVTLPNGRTLPANPDAYTLNFEQAVDVSNVMIANSVQNQYHKIIVRGARRTTTFTVRIAKLTDDWEWTSAVIMGPNWTKDLQTEYQKGASTAADYGTLDTIQQQFRNSVYRRSERMAAVYSQFTLNTQDSPKNWAGQIPREHKPLGDPDVSYWLVPNIVPSTVDPTSPDATTAGGDWIAGTRITPFLPLYEGCDYSAAKLLTFDYATQFPDQSPSFLRPLIYARTAFPGGVDENARFEPLDRMHRPGLVPTQEEFRNWSVSVSPLATAPGIELKTRVQHFLGGAGTGFGGDWANTSDEDLGDQHGAIDYKDIWATLCVELNIHLETSLALSAAATGAPENTLLINVPDARADYVLPYTTLEIKDGKPIQTTSGGWAKDDRDRLASIARGAAEWYGKERQALRMTFSQIRSLVSLGWLITSVGSNYSLASINTPITAITYDLGDENTPGNTTFETGYANLEFRT